MIRNLAKQLTPSVRSIATSSSASQSSTSLSRASLFGSIRSFASSSSQFNSESDKSAQTQQLESSASGQPTTDPSPAGSSNVSDALSRDLSAAADAEAAASTSTSGDKLLPPTSTTFLDPSLPSPRLPFLAANLQLPKKAQQQASASVTAPSFAAHQLRATPPIYSSARLPLNLIVSSSTLHETTPSSPSLLPPATLWHLHPVEV